MPNHVPNPQAAIHALPCSQNVYFRGTSSSIKSQDYSNERVSGMPAAHPLAEEVLDNFMRPFGISRFGVVPQFPASG